MKVNIDHYIVRSLLVTAIATLFACSGGTKVQSSSSAGENTSGHKYVKQDFIKAEEVFIDAEKALMLENYDEARKLFERSIKLDPNIAAAWYELARIDLKSNLYPEGLSKIKRAVEIAPENKWYLLLNAQVLTAMNDHKDAAKAFEKLTEIESGNPQNYFDWAFQLIKQEKYEDAIKVLDNMEREYGIDENAIAQKQQLYLKVGKLDKAVEEARKLISLYPDEPKYYRMLAEIYEANGMYKEAMDVHKEVLKMDPDNAYSSLSLAEMYRKQDDSENYIKHMKAAFANPKLNIDAKIGILIPYVNVIAENEDRKKEALALADILEATHPEEAKTYAMYGDLLYHAEETEKALPYYKKSLEYNDGVFLVWQQIFFIESELNKFEAMLEDTDKALELFPTQAIVYFFNGVANSQLKKYNEAISSLKQGLLYTGENNALKAQLYSNLGDSYNSIEAFADSDSSFENALRLEPDNAFVLNNYSYYLTLRKEGLEKAEKMSKKSNELVPNNASFLDTYAWVLYNLGKYSEAKVWIEKSLSSGGEDRGVILDHYGDILFKLGETDKAVELWINARDEGVESKVIDDKIREKKLIE